MHCCVCRQKATDVDDEYDVDGGLDMYEAKRKRGNKVSSNGWVLRLCCICLCASCGCKAKQGTLFVLSVSASHCTLILIQIDRLLSLKVTHICGMGCLLQASQPCPQAGLSKVGPGQPGVCPKFERSRVGIETKFVTLVCEQRLSTHDGASSMLPAASTLCCQKPIAPGGA